MTGIRAWLHAKAWRPVTIVFVLAMVLIGGAFDYAAGQREDQCKSGNRTVMLIKEVIRVTFDDGTPPLDPDAPAPSVDDLRAFIGQRLAGNAVYQELAPKDQALVVDLFLILTTESSGQSTAETRLTRLADSLHLDSCSGALIF